MGNRWVTQWLVAASAALLLAAAGLAGCSQATATLAKVTGWSQANPTVTFESMRIQRLGLDSTDYLATCQVTNPNPSVLTLNEVHWTLAADQFEVNRGEVLKTTELPPNKTIPFHIHVEVPYRNLDRAGLADRRRFDYQFTGQMQASGALGPISLTFSSQGQMPIVHPLKVALRNVTVIGVTESRVGLNLDTVVTNDNDIPLTPSELTGQLLVNERPLVAIESNLPEGVSIPPHRSVPLRIPLWVASPEVGVQSLSKILATPDRYYRLTGMMTFRPPNTGDVRELLAEPGSAPAAQTQPASAPN